ncbi:MAG TPA: SPFH and helix-turn-helix domain-containing protein [Tepidisphaeraceae bacterium]|jgi:excisionase family DNA binding protein|nr:SPFH and helix-turn-helix domain-containing protein [Tepidisphaeraceae bacterium]
MALMDFIRGELIEIIEFNDDSRDTISWRFPDSDREIKRGAQLIVRESQVAQFVYLGQFGDTFGPGKHELITDNIPVLTTLKGWKYGFESPFKADVYFVNTRLFTGNKWGTSNPVMMRDADFGVVRLRAFGTYDFRVVEPRLFLKEIVGTDHNFRLDEFADTMRSRLVSVFSDALATAKVPALDVASRYGELGDALVPLINPIMTSKYGIAIESFIVENVSVPPEVEEAIDKRSSMSVVGNLNDYVKFQMGKGMATGGGAGSGGAAAEMAIGFGIAQEMMRGTGGAVGGVAPGGGAFAGATSQSTTASGGTAAAASATAAGLMGLPEVAQYLGVTEADVMAAITAGDLKAKKIGSQYRITRTAIDEFLAS